jgi:hypothetical protein
MTSRHTAHACRPLLVMPPDGKRGDGTEESTLAGSSSSSARMFECYYELILQ